MCSVESRSLSLDGDRIDLPPQETSVTEQVDLRRYSGSLNWNHTFSPSTFYAARSSLIYYYRNTYYGAEQDPNAWSLFAAALPCSRHAGTSSRRSSAPGPSSENAGA